MKYVEDTSLTPNGAYPVYNASTPRLALKGSDGSLALAFHDPNQTGLLRDYVQLNGGTLIAPQVTLNPAGSFYGFDITVRNAHCNPTSGECIFAISGELALFVNRAQNTVACAGFNATTEIARATVSGLDLSGTITVGCYADQQKVWAHVKGRLPETSPNGLTYNPSPNTGAVHYEVGAAPTPPKYPGVGTGDVARMRFWTDLTKMKSDLGQTGP